MLSLNTAASAGIDGRQAIFHQRLNVGERCERVTKNQKLMETFINQGPALSVPSA